MRKLRWQLIVVLVALVAIFLLLLGQQPALISGGEPAVEPVSGGVYIEALVGAPGRLNPLLDSYNAVDRDVDRLLYSGLVRFDHRGLPQGDLADSWGISQDGKVYNFSINTDAVFHDGQPVTSDDVIFTIGYMRDAQIPLPRDLRNFWKQVDVKALDEKTIQFRLPEPFAPFLDYLTFGILPKHLLSGVTADKLVDAEFNLHPVGSGPFKFVQFETEGEQISGVILAAFDQFYKQKPFIEQVIFRYYPDSASALIAYREDEVMGINQLTSDVLVEALKEPQLSVFTGRLPRLSIIFFNLDDPSVPFLQDPTVRRALLLGINRQWIIDRLLDSQAILANGPIFPDSWAYYEGIERLGYDPDAAIALLKNAEYVIPAEGGSVRSKEGIPLAFEMVIPDQEPYLAIAERIKADWAVLGVRVDLLPVPYEELISDYLDPREYQTALVELDLARSPDPDPYPFWHQAQASGGQNYSRWDDRQVSEYLEQARVIVDISERLKRYRNFQVRFAIELPALPLFYPVYSYGIKYTVQGVSMGPLFDSSDRFNNILEWFLFTGPAGNLESTGTP